MSVINLLKNTNLPKNQYAVIGNPISHSQSPFIHTTFAEQTGQQIVYKTLLVSRIIGALPDAIQAFQADGGKGLNITVPFKQQTWTLVQQRSQRAERAGAVNTVWFDSSGQWIGDNTDGIGLVRDLLNNHGGKVANQRVLILGAGGAVRGVLEPLLKENPQLCVIANRTVSKAQELAQLFADLGEVHGCGYSELAGQSFDLIVNGTSASLQGELPPLPNGILAEEGWCYDMMYAKSATPYLCWAFTQGAARAIDGLGMLVEQAAESFYLWHSVRPQTAPVIQQVRERLAVTTGENTALKSIQEIGGPQGLEPTRYGDWERKGRCIDF